MRSGFFAFGCKMEKWRRIEGFPGYSISSYGRVRSIIRTHGRKDGIIYREKILNVNPKRRGYLGVSLQRNGKVIGRLIHTLVLLAFIGKRPSGKVANHKDGNKHNNKVENLEYVTPKENTQHAAKHGLMKRGQEHYKAKLTEQDVKEIYKLKGIYPQKEIARKFRVSKSAIAHILTGRTWKYLQVK
jgi:hypothetical protein